MSGARAQRNDVVTIKVPFTVRQRGGRKLVLAPDGAPMPPTAAHIDSTLVKAIARAFRWQKMLETGRYATITEIAKAEKINASYVSRVLRLTLLAPTLVEAILDGRADEAPTLAEAMKVFPVEWVKQSLGAGPLPPPAASLLVAGPQGSSLNRGRTHAHPKSEVGAWLRRLLENLPPANASRTRRAAS